MTSSRLFAIALVSASAAACGGQSSPTAPPTDPYPNGPSITCPAAPAAITSASGGPIPVQYGTPTATGGAPNVAVNCAPPSGSTFPIGSTAVVCSAVDARQRSSSCTFTIVVQQPPRITLTRFEAFGDSITWGEDGRNEAIITTLDERVRPRVRFALPLTYPGQLLTALVNRYPSQPIVVSNFGSPGERAQDPETLARLANVTSTGTFEVLLLMEGTNDIFYGDATQIDPAIAGLRAMIRLAKGRSLRVFLATVPPIVAGASRGGGAGLVPALNAQIRALAQSEAVTLVDVWAAFGANFSALLGADGLHPNADGYAKIAETFFTVLTSTLEPRTTTLAAPLSGSPYSRPLRPR